MNRRWMLCTVVVLLTGFWVRVWRLGAESIWHDEGWSIRAIYSPFGTPDDNTPYGYYTLMHWFWKLGIGESPFAFRYGSVLIGIVMVAVALIIMRRWYGEWTAFLAGMAVAVSPLMWDYAQEVRAYVAVPLFALLLLAIGERLTSYGGEKIIPPRWWVGLFLAEFLGIYTHNLVIPVVIWLNIAVGLIWLLRQDWQRLINWAFVHALLVLAYLPWLSTQSPSGTPLNSTPTLGLKLLKDIWRSYFLPVLPQLRQAEDTLWLDALGILVVMAILVLAIRQPTRRTWLLLSHVILVPFWSAVLIITAHIDFHPRYFVAAVPATLMALVAGFTPQQSFVGVAYMPSRVPRQFRISNTGRSILRPYYIPAILTVILVIWVSVTSLWEIRDNRAYQHDDFQALAEYYATLPDSTIILIPFDREPALQDYFAKQMNIRARFVNIPLYSSEDKVLDYLRGVVLDTARPVEFLTWYQLPADVRGMYPCILTASTDATIPPPQTFYGLQTQHYEVAIAPRFTPLVARPVYQELRFQGADSLVSMQGACVRSRWEMVEPTAQDLGVVVELFNDGIPIIRSDVQMADDAQITTTQWERGDRGNAYNLLPLIPGMPRDTYALQLRVYSAASPNGLKLLGESIGVQGTDYPFPEVISLEGPIYDGVSEDHPVLLEDNAPESKILDGTQPLKVTVLINGVQPNEFAQVVLRLAGDGWLVRHSARFEGDAPSLAWVSFTLPPEAQGTATLSVWDVPVATYEVQQPERLFEMPSFGLEVNEKFPGVGTLLGADLPTTDAKLDVPFEVTFVWHANTATDIGYMVFAQLLSADGVLLAQSDSIPMQGQRPTTGWVPDEFLVDNHRLTWRVDNYEGLADLIVGFYDPLTGNRVRSGTGEEFVRLPVEINVSR